MKPKIKLLFTVFLCSISSVLIAQPVNINTAKAIAEHHLAAIHGSSLKSAGSKIKNFQFTSVKATVENKDTLYYILNDTINKGFVIVSADKRAWPILGYSTEGSFNEKKQPEAFTAWMESRKKEIESIKKNNIKPDQETSEYWNNLSLKSAVIETPSVEPLLKTKWNQGCYYNELCPSDARSFYCGHTPTGCVATAMAQIMKYWNYPTNGKGSNSYLSSIYGKFMADFGSTTYQWSQMPDKLTTYNDAVAKLMLHCGISNNMRYGPKESGALISTDKFVNYFNYSSEAEYVDKKAYLYSDWVNLLKTELDLRRPIYYWGTDQLCGGGHVFICDGYQDIDYFHFNWGWGGIADGYFYLNNLNPNLIFSFSTFQRAIIKIFPDKMPDGYKGLFLSTNTIGVGNKGGTTDTKIISSSEWSASTDQSWLNINSGSGAIGSNKISLTASANPTTKVRKAIVTISALGLTPRTIEVTQYGIIETSAGNLKTVLGGQLSLITHLSLTGTIDARDFKTMRDEMPALTDIDLSNVRIDSYTGTEGTIIKNYSWTYPANAIPNFAFLLPESTLSKTRLKSIILPPSITSINDYAFLGCKNLTIESIPPLVTSIGDGAFLECSCLSSLIIPAATASIGSDAFESFKGIIIVDNKNPNYSSADGVLYNKTQTRLIQCPISKTGDVTIPSTVTSIRNNAFFGCSVLTKVMIPSSVKSIEAYAFNNCTGLAAITIPSSITSLGQRVFGGFKGSIDVDSNNPNYSSLDGVLFDKKQNELIECPVSKAGVYTIPSATTMVDEEAFHSCADIASLIIPQSVKNIGSSSFFNCEGLSSIYLYTPIPPNIMNSPLIFFGTVDTLNCILNVPLGTKSIYQANKQWKVFSNIVEMTGDGLYVSDKNISIGFSGGTAQVSLSSSTNWTASSDQPWLTITPGSGKIGSSSILFTAKANPTTSGRKAIVTISATGFESQTIEVIQYGSVEVTAGNLKSILGSQLTNISELTLTGTIDARDFKTMRDFMPALTSINMKDVTIVSYSGTDGPAVNYLSSYPSNEIPSEAFYNGSISVGKETLKSIVLPTSAVSIGSFAFGRCSGLNSINISSSITSIGYHAFTYFKGLMVVDVDNPQFSSLDGILFNKDKSTLIQCSCSKEGEYIIPSSVKMIEATAFSGCNVLSSITIPSSVTSIEEGTFSYCTGLKSIIISSSVISIGRFAFTGCNRLTAITVYSKSPVNLDNSMDVFSNVSQNTCILNVPYGSGSLYRTANQWKDFTNIVEMPGLTISTMEAKVAALANSTTSVTIKSNVAWTAVSDQAWLTIDKTSGSGDQTLTFTAQENASAGQRTAIVTVLASNVPQTITVIQEGKNITGIGQLSINMEFKVYPNPTTGKILLVFDKVPQNGISITVNNITGKSFFKKLIYEKESWIDLSGNVPGIYFIKTDQKTFGTQKVILK